MTMFSRSVVVNDPYRDCLVKISRLLTEKDTAELALQYDLDATQPAAILRAIEKKRIISQGNPASVTSLLQKLDNQTALSEWQTSFVDVYAHSNSDASSNSECDYFQNGSPDIQAHMKKALEVAQNSKDTNTKVGAVIIGQYGQIVSDGYNHMPGQKEAFSWSREGNWLETKYPYVSRQHLLASEICASTAITVGYSPFIEAAVDAINNCEIRSDLVGAILITTLRPGNISAIQIVEAKIKEVWYYEDKHKCQDHIIAGERILRENGIPCRQIPDNFAKSRLV